MKKFISVLAIIGFFGFIPPTLTFAGMNPATSEIQRPKPPPHPKSLKKPKPLPAPKKPPASNKPGKPGKPGPPPRPPRF